MKVVIQSTFGQKHRRKPGPKPKLTPAQVEAIRKAHQEDDQIDMNQIAKLHGVSKQTIYNALDLSNRKGDPPKQENPATLNSTRGFDPSPEGEDHVLTNNMNIVSHKPPSSPGEGPD